MWTKHRAGTSMMTEWPKCEQAEPKKVVRWYITPFIAQKLKPKMLQAIIPAASSPEALQVISLMIVRD